MVFFSKGSSNRLQQKLILGTGAGVFLVSAIIALISSMPLYKDLKESQEQDLRFNLKTRILAVDQFLERTVDIAEQISSRTTARQLLEGYNQGQATRAELVDFTTQILAEAMDRTPTIVGISRLDQTQTLITQVGLTAPSHLWPVVNRTSRQSAINGPVVIGDGDTAYVLVSAPILNAEQQQVGTDIVIFNLGALQTIIQDYSGLGETGETILAHANGDTVSSIFPLRHQATTVSPRLPEVIETAAQAQDTGFLRTNDGTAVAFESIPGTHWTMIVRMSQSELYATVNHDLIITSIAIVVLSIFATAAMVLILRPLTQRVIDADELEKEVRQKATALDDLKRVQVQLVQAEKMSSLGQLVAGVAHEINNPVNFIHGNLIHLDEAVQNILKLMPLCQSEVVAHNPAMQQIVEDSDLEYLAEDLPQLMASMKLGTERIRNIVLSLRNFSRLDQAEFKEVDIHDGIDSTLMLLQNRLKPQTHPPSIHVIKHYGQIPKVECYAGQLNQVFMNILVNAIDALESASSDPSFQEIQPSSPTLTITTERTATNTVTIQISDNGPGMAESIRKKIFEPFFTTKPIGKGTGMGLSISYQLVTETHKGQLACLSDPGKGTTFVIELPLQQTCVKSEEMQLLSLVGGNSAQH